MVDKCPHYEISRDFRVLSHCQTAYVIVRKIYRVSYWLRRKHNCRELMAFLGFSQFRSFMTHDSQTVFVVLFLFEARLL